MNQIPDLMPVLSRGKHRHPRKGACFMELASYLAGERWSDHPRCTHPLLASLARDVNDNVGDPARVWLAPLVPEVVGLTSDDPRAHPWIAREAALTALPVVSMEKQGVAAVALFLCEKHLADLEGRPADSMSAAVGVALDEAPQARRWAEAYLDSNRWSTSNFDVRSAPRIVHSAVWGIAAACQPDTDEILVDLLRRTVQNCEIWFEHDPDPVEDVQWRELCELTLH